MEIYGNKINPITIEINLDRLTNLCYKLLPTREEGNDWKKPIETLIIELMGLHSFLPEDRQLFTLVCKLEGLRAGGENIDFTLYRRTIFECCNLISKVKNNVLNDNGD